MTSVWAAGFSLIAIYTFANESVSLPQAGFYDQVYYVTWWWEKIMPLIVSESRPLLPRYQCYKKGIEVDWKLLEISSVYSQCTYTKDRSATVTFNPPRIGLFGCWSSTCTKIHSSSDEVHVFC